MARLLEHLEQEYGLVRPPATLMAGAATHHELDALLAFRSDPWLEELHQAMERLDDGTFGLCLSCKRRIPRETLLLNPVQRVCAACEEEFLAHDTREDRAHIML
jgi:RNA polymerase-binding transcription factor DksA